MVGSACWCIWWDGGWEVHVVYLEEWCWELNVDVFGGKVGGRCMWCIWRNGGAKCMSVCLVGRWVGCACGVSGGMVVGTPCGCIWWEGGWEVHVVYTYLEELWWELHVGVFGGKVGGACGVSGGVEVESACLCVWWEGGKVGGRRMLVCMCLPESQQINICNIDE